MSSSAEPLPLLILGLGNLLCADDAAGVRAVERLNEKYLLPDGVQAMDGGTRGMALLPLLQDAERLILVDAVTADEPPGSLVRLEGPDVAKATAHQLSLHQLGVAELLDAARLMDALPSTIILVGVVPESVEFQPGLSEAVAGALPRLVAQVAAEAAMLGFPLRPRPVSQSS